SLELIDSITKLVNNWWYDRYQEDPNIIMEVDKVEACKEIVKRGIGYSIVPYSCLTEKDAFHTFDLTTLSGIVLARKTWMLYKKNAVVGSSVEVFINNIKQMFSDT